MSDVIKVFTNLFEVHSVEYQWYQISPEEIIAFGDHDNDVEMLQAAGLGVAVANASPLCKEVADCHTLSNEEGGVAATLKEIFGVQFSNE